MDTTKTLEQVTIAGKTPFLVSPNDNDANYFVNKLKNISYSSTTVYGSFGGGVETISFPNCISLYAKFNNTAITSLYLPNCTNISIYGGRTFYNCTKLSIVSLPVCVNMAAETFRNCPNLMTVDMPVLTSTLQSSIFAYCTKLSNINLPNLTYAINYTFYNCGMSILSLPKLQTAMHNCFAYCTNLKLVSLPHLTILQSAAFSDCTSLSTVMLGPAAVTIYSSAFYNCQKLEYFILPNITGTGTLMNANAFNNTPLSNSTYLGYFGSIYVPSSLVTTMQTTGYWATYAARITSIENLPASIKTELGIE